MNSVTQKQPLLSHLALFGQEQLLVHWNTLTDLQRQGLVAQIDSIDFEQLASLYKNRNRLIDVAAMITQAIEPPAYLFGGNVNTIPRSDAIQAGRNAIAAGKVAALVVAGGQGTRLGFDHPKGMYSIGPVGDTTLFQIHVEKILARSRHYGKPIPLCIMTSPATHDETIEFFSKHNRFGLAESDLHIFCQGTMPVVSIADGKILLAAPDQIAMSPDGHGGMLAALHASGGFDWLRSRGVVMLFYFQVDNPLVDVANEEFLGYHILSRSELTSQVVRKQSPQEKVGNIVSINKRLHVIEYSDLPDEYAARRKPDGSLEIWAGSIAVHVMELDFLARQTECKSSLPFHVAKKKTPYLDASGNLVQPLEPNAIKFERFIFDLLPAADNAIVVEVDPRYHFAPLKNCGSQYSHGISSPTDTPESVRDQLSGIYIEWLTQAGVRVAPSVRVEISPLFAYSLEMLADRVKRGFVSGVIESDLQL